jgi:uncharacterized membrane protein YfcA
MGTPSEIFFILAIGLVAILYSSVGHGGASGYLAMMALFGIDVAVMKPSALILNLFVSSIAFISYYRAGHFKLRILLPFVVASIPMAFLGATLKVPPELYKKILGACLVIAALRILIRTGEEGERKKISVPVALAAGALIGFCCLPVGLE